MRRFADWLTRKWSRTIDPSLVEDYRVVFSTASGQRILQHWLDQTYCTVYEGHDPMQAVAHNALRSFVHDILLNIDHAEQPQKYEVRQEGNSDS